MGTNQEFKFRMGDRVVIVKDSPDGNTDLVCGVTGTVLSDRPSTNASTKDPWWPVRYDIEIKDGHDCARRCEYGFGWNTAQSYLDLYVEEDFDIGEVSDLFGFLGI